MAINPQILAKIFGGAAPASMDPDMRRQIGMQSLGAMGASMLANSRTNTGSAPGFAQVLGQGMLTGMQAQQQGISAAQEQQANELAIQKAQQQQEAAKRQQEFIRRMFGGAKTSLYSEAAPRRGEGGTAMADAQGAVFSGGGIESSALSAANKVGRQLGGISPGMEAPEVDANNPFANLPDHAKQLLMTMSPENQQKVLAQLAFPEPADMPARVQEAQIVSQQTGRPVGEILAEWRAKDGTNVNVSVGGPQVYTGDRDSAYGKAMGQLAAKDIEGLRNAADKSAEMLRTYDSMNRLLEGIETGTFTGTTTQIVKAAESLGIDTGAWGDNVSAVEAARSLQNQLALQIRNPDSGMGLPGATSNRDIQFLLDSIPSINMTPAGRRAITEVIRGRANLARKLSTEAQAYLEMKERNGETPILDSGWEQRKQQIIDQSTDFRQAVEAARQASQQQPATQQPQRRVIPDPLNSNGGVTQPAGDQSIDDLLNIYGG